MKTKSQDQKHIDEMALNISNLNQSVMRLCEILKQHLLECENHNNPRFEIKF